MATSRFQSRYLTFHWAQRARGAQRVSLVVLYSSNGQTREIPISAEVRSVTAAGANKSARHLPAFRVIIHWLGSAFSRCMMRASSTRVYSEHIIETCCWHSQWHNPPSRVALLFTYPRALVVVRPIELDRILEYRLIRFQSERISHRKCIVSFRVNCSGGAPGADVAIARV